MVEGRGGGVSGKKRNRCSICINVGLYEVFISCIIFCLIFYFITVLTTFFFIFVASLSLRESSSEIIVQKYFSWNIIRPQMNGGGDQGVN